MCSFLLLSDQFYGIQIVSFQSSMKLISASDCTALGRDPGQCSRTYLVLRPSLYFLYHNSITTNASSWTTLRCDSLTRNKQLVVLITSITQCCHGRHYTCRQCHPLL